MKITDKQRMDWLVSKCVEVRHPARYGSFECFHAQELTDEEDDHHATDLREQIDREILSSNVESSHANGVE